jgi:acyl dehydratase
MSAAVQIESLDALSKMVGQEVAVSDWVEITQERINQFAQATEDFQWIHVDLEKAKHSPTGGTIAHGFLTLSLVAGFSQRTIRIGDVRMGINYGVNRVRFTSMVPAGSRLRGRFVLLNTEPIEGGLQIFWKVTVEREGSDKPACVAETIGRAYR